MSSDRILLLHPGEMGGAIGERLIDKGLTVCWVGDGRSDDTRQRAEQAGLQDCGTLRDGLKTCNLVISVCPPHGAVELAKQVAAEGYSGRFIDGNAIAPATSQQVGEIVSAAGAQFTDGGIIGPPPANGGQCRLYLSGGYATELQALLASPPLQVIALPGEAGAASALKMCFAGWNKARIGLLMNLRALAHVHGVEAELFEEWQTMDPAVMRFVDDTQPARTVMASARKAWRWGPEMTEIAATFSDAGLPADYHHGAADVFNRLSDFKDRGDIPKFAEIAAALLDSPNKSS